MSEMVDRVARRLNPQAFETLKHSLVGSLERGMAVIEISAAKVDARAAIEAMRELPSDPGPRYDAGEYSRRTHEAMIEDALR